MARLHHWRMCVAVCALLTPECRVDKSYGASIGSRYHHFSRVRSDTGYAGIGQRNELTIRNQYAKCVRLVHLTLAFCMASAPMPRKLPLQEPPNGPCTALSTK